MVGTRCCDRIGEELRKLEIGMPEISQGVVEFHEELDGAQLLRLKEGLLELGFEVVSSGQNDLLDQVSSRIRDLIYQEPGLDVGDYPAYIEAELNPEDPDLMKVFSQVHGVDLVQYAAIQQVERIKEMLLYEDVQLKEIVEIFHFKNRNHLTQVFEGMTGLTPSYYKKIRKKREKIRMETQTIEY